MIGLSVTLLVAALAWTWRPQPRPRSARAQQRLRRYVPAAILATAALRLSAILSGVGVIAVFVARRAVRLRRARVVRRRIYACYPDALDLLVLSIRAGWLPAVAMGEIRADVDPCLQPALQRVTEAMNGGVRFADALQHLTAEWGALAHALVDSLAAADRYGLPLAPVLERLAADARQQRRRDAEASARELPVRLAVPLVVCTLPSYVLIAIVPLLLGALTSLRM